MATRNMDLLSDTFTPILFIITATTNTTTSTANVPTTTTHANKQHPEPAIYTYPGPSYTKQQSSTPAR